MWNDLRRAWIVTRREVRDQFRDWRIMVPIGMLTLFFPGLMNFTAKQVVGYVQRYDVPLIGDRLIPFLLMVVGFFPISISLVIALESFVGEKERRSIEPLLSSPLTDLQLYLGKLLAVIIPPVAASYLGIAVYLVGVYRQVGWVPNAELFIQVVVLTTVQALVMVSGAVVISVQATSARAANLLASFIIVPMAMLLIGESMVMFWARYNVLWWAIVGQILIAGLLIRTGIAYFNREELLGREFDTLNLRWNGLIFWRAFRGEAQSLGEWYRHVWTRTLPGMRLPILAVMLVLLGGVWVGVQQAEVFALPPQALDWSHLENGFVGGDGWPDAIRFFSVHGVGAVLFQNLRAITLATVLGLFTFGVMGLLVLMLPFTLIGYFAATVARAGVSPVTFLLAFVLPHGVLEIPAIIIAGAALFQVGATLTAPARGRTMSEALVESLANWLKVLLAVAIPLFLLAAVLEIYFTPWVATRIFGG